MAMARARVSGRDSEIAMTQAWHTLVDTIRQLPSAPGATSVAAEKATLELALDQLSALIALRRGGRGESGTPEATPPPSSQGKRKRRPSHSSPGLLSESGLSSAASPRPAQAGKRRGPAPSALSQSTPAAGGKAPPGGAGAGDELRIGAKVAARQKAPDGEWVLATVRARAGAGRWEVQDADDGSRWVVGAAQLTKLPTGDARVAFRKGDTVHALYPDTTSFYKATVLHPLEGRAYKLAFVDDGDNISEVDRDFVVQYRDR